MRSMPFDKKSLLLLPILSIGLITGCHHHPVIWGTWTETSVRQLYKTNGSVTSDETSYFSGSVVFTFTVGGGYFSTNSDGRYIQTGSTLQLIDTTSMPQQTAWFHINTLTDQLLVLQYIDTISVIPLSTVQYTYTLSPQ